MLLANVSQHVANVVPAFLADGTQEYLLLQRLWVETHGRQLVVSLFPDTGHHLVGFGVRPLLAQSVDGFQVVGQGFSPSSGACPQTQAALVALNQVFNGQTVVVLWLWRKLLLLFRSDFSLLVFVISIFDSHSSRRYVWLDPLSIRIFLLGCSFSGGG